MQRLAHAPLLQHAVQPGDLALGRAGLGHCLCQLDARSRHSLLLQMRWAVSEFVFQPLDTLLAKEATQKRPDLGRREHLGARLRLSQQLQRLLIEPQHGVNGCPHLGAAANGGRSRAAVDNHLSLIASGRSQSAANGDGPPARGQLAFHHRTVGLGPHAVGRAVQTGHQRRVQRLRVLTLKSDQVVSLRLKLQVNPVQGA